MPRWPAKNAVDSQEQTIGQDKSVILPAEGSIIDAVHDLNDVEVVDKPLPKSAIDNIAFMEEKVTVMIHEDTNPNAENPVQVACNGVNQFFFRGQQQDVKRKYVEILARAKRTSISTPEVTDSSGARTNAIRQATALRYPFQVVWDPNPKGAAWLKAVMAEAN